MATLIRNKQATYNHEVLETFEAGVSLHGFEVKSLRKKQGSLKGAYVTAHENGAQLVGAHIPPYQASNTPESYDPYRARDLLLKKSELNELIGKAAQKGLTVVPISLYTKGRFVKLEMAVVRGKKKYDKRQSLKKRDTERELRRDLKQNVRL